MKYLGRLLCYLAIFLFTFSVSCVIVLRFLPVTVTPVKIIKWFENLSEGQWLIRSNWVSLEKINPTMPRAVVATEDNFFLQHHGFDIEAIKLAIEYNKQGRKIRGASTISQQTAKNVFCTPDRTWFRKAVESYYTVLIELLWNKERIMEVYLNIIETRPNIYGVEATAERFYDKPAEKLNTYEAAMIATVLPSPRRMNLAAPSAYMQRRSTTVRSLMAKLPPVDFDDPKPPVKNSRYE